MDGWPQLATCEIFVATSLDIADGSVRPRGFAHSRRRDGDQHCVQTGTSDIRHVHIRHMSTYLHVHQTADISQTFVHQTSDMCTPSSY